VGGPAELTEAQRRSLRADGYLFISSVLGPAAIDSIAKHLREQVRAMWDAWTPSTEWEEGGVVRIPLDVRDPRFKELVEHPLLLSAAEWVVGPGAHVNDLSLRAPIPGYGHQGLHADFPEQRTAGPWQVLAGTWCISEFTHDNGPLRVVPGSHRSPRDLSDDMEWVGMGPHPNELKLVGPPGSLILFNSASLWHSGTFNYNHEPRLAVTTYLRPPEVQGRGRSKG
jgi:Phytanoyl-CoA dioxygenase (PhyH)